MTPLKSLLAGIVLAVALTAGWFIMRDAVLANAAQRRDVSAWMRHEFGLDEQAMRRIGALQQAFESECEVHCRKVAQAKAVMESSTAPTGRESFLRALEECRSARVVHVREVAACMPAAAGADYLRVVLPKLEGADHDGAPDLSGQTRGR